MALWLCGRASCLVVDSGMRITKGGKILCVVKNGKKKKVLQGSS